jgi:hypothetical protein
MSVILHLAAFEDVEATWCERRLALRYRDDRRGYTDAKGPFLWEVIRRADAWAQGQGWQPGPLTPELKESVRLRYPVRVGVR